MFFVELHTFSLDLIHLFRWENYDYVEYNDKQFWIEVNRIKLNLHRHSHECM